MKLLLIPLILILACGKINKDSHDITTTDIYAPTTTEISKDMDFCSKAISEVYCSCLNQAIYNRCSKYNAYADNTSFKRCISPYLEDAYLGYCNINRNWGML